MKKSIYSLYQLFTIMKAANYRYPEFIPSFDDHSNGSKKLTKVTSPVIENECFYRGLNFFAEQDLKVMEAISRGEYMTFEMQGKNIRRQRKKLLSKQRNETFSFPVSNLRNCQ